MNSKVSITEVPKVIVEVPVIRLILDLTQEDVNAIYEMTGVIGGNSNKTRGVFDEIRYALGTIASKTRCLTYITSESGINFKN